MLLVQNSVKAQYDTVQGVKLYPLNHNQALKAAHLGYLPEHFVRNQNAFRRNQTDTLDLPFFDDFTSTVVYPDQRLWTDSLVYINSNFPVSPPSFGVATFDNLDKFGNAYGGFGFTMDQFGGSDTLTSKPINLEQYTLGGNLIPYQIADSIYLSFFYQAQGIGDLPQQRDSFVVQFKQNNGQWVSVWSVNGMRLSPFVQVMVPLLNSDFLWNAFQFRFINYTYAMGNLNHVHLDYVRMNRNRSVSDTLIRDVAINKKNPSLLTTYYSMPYDHYLVNPTKYTKDEISIGVRNNDVDIINTRFQYECFKEASLLVVYPFANSSRNIFAQSDTTERFNAFNFSALPANEMPVLRSVFSIDPQAGNTTEGVYNSLGNNDVFESKQVFANYYAYDDGSAEGGIGLAYKGLPPGRGTFAVQFDIEKRDTLVGLSFFFNQSLENVSNRPFNLCLWDKLTEGSQEEKPFYELPVMAPTYTDSINGFHHYILDTLIVLPAGTYYFGWSQTGKFNLNVGYDMNYAQDEGVDGNKKVFFNMLGSWQSLPPSIKGTPMIRSIVGVDLKFPLHQRQIKLPNSTPRKLAHLYPNPFNNELNIELYKQESTSFVIKSITGKSIWNGVLLQNGKLDLSHLVPGYYMLEISNKQLIQTEKIIKY